MKANRQFFLRGAVTALLFGVVTAAAVLGSEAPDRSLSESLRLDYTSFFAELQAIHDESTLRIQAIQADADQARSKHHRIERLRARGFAAQEEVRQTGLKADLLEAEMWADQSIRQAVEQLQATLRSAHLTGQTEFSESFDDPMLDINVPGLTTGSGVAQFFTVQNRLTPGILQSLTSSYQARTVTRGDVPHPNAYHKWLQDHSDKIQQLSSASSVEKERALYSVVSSQHRAALGTVQQQQTQMEVSRLRQLLRSNDQEGSSASRSLPRLYAAPSTIASHASSLVHAKIADAAFWAQSQKLRDGEAAVARAERDIRQLHHQLLSASRRAAHVSQVEKRTAQHQADLGHFSLEAAEEISVQRQADADLMRDLATVLDVRPQPFEPTIERAVQPAAWLTTALWKTDEKTEPSTDDVQTVLHLFRSWAQLTTKEQQAQIQQQAAQSRLQSLRALSRPTASELKRQELEVQRRNHLQQLAAEARQDASLQLEMWVRSYHRQDDSFQITLTTEQRSDIEQLLLKHSVAKAVSAARQAQWEAQIAEADHQFQWQHLKRLEAVHRAGSASEYELHQTQQKVRGAEGRSLTAARKQENAGQQVALLSTLRNEDLLQIDEHGEIVLAAMTEEVRTQLTGTLLQESQVDAGRLIELNAQQARYDARLSELSRLLQRGYASSSETAQMEVFVQVTENLIAMEKTKQRQEKAANELVSQLF
ncbi:MAG: hypothetical protein AAF357_07475, partial [Verrucomicrobiota bacterium]